MKRKAQTQQIFIFIIAIVIAAMIFLYGYKVIGGFIQRTEDISITQFKTDLQTAIRTVSSSYGDVKRLELSVPSTFERVCFVDFSEYDKNKNSEFCISEPVVCDAWADQTQNVFLIPLADIPIKVPLLKIQDPGYTCPRIINGKVILRLQGLGDKTLVSEWQ